LDDFLQLYLLFYLLIKCTKSTFSEKTGYFGTYVLFGLFHLLKLEQACTSSKKFCAGLLMCPLPAPITKFDTAKSDQKPAPSEPQ
jgi:hypothetical protein